MAKAGLLFLGTDDGLIILSNPGAIGRWVRAGHELSGSAITAIAVNPNDPQQILAAGRTGVWRSTDGAQTWTPAQAADLPPTPPAPPLDEPPPAAILAAATLPGHAPTTLVALTDGTIMRSSVGTSEWEAVQADQPWNGMITALTTAPYHMDTAFAGSDTGHVLMSTDRGRTWQTIRTGLAPIRSIAAARLV